MLFLAICPVNRLLAFLRLHKVVLGRQAIPQGRLPEVWRRPGIALRVSTPLLLKKARIVLLALTLWPGLCNLLDLGRAASTIE